MRHRLAFLWLAIVWAGVFCCTPGAVAFGQEEKARQVAPSAPQAESLVGILDADGQYSFALQYYQSQDNGRAASEFDRFVHFFPDDPRVPEAMMFAAEAMFRDGRHPDALKRFEAIADRFPGTRFAVRSQFEAARCLQALQQPEAARALLLRIADTAATPEIRDEALYRVAWIDVEDARFDAADASLAKIGVPGRQRYRIDALQAGLREAGAIPRKDPALAGALSIIPGGGYAYCGRYRDATVAFLLNAAFIAATIEAFREGNDALGCLIGFVGSGFYMGNIYGGVNAAEKYNRNAVRVFIERTASDYRVDPRTGKTDGIGIRIQGDF
ncbi:tetratricopeptide repeat protein [Desulfatirhabdium butyrativorans]|uniref:tetratricopeptide repeat protein n=1 Tax=Desulfatirhabdium butyrativorans TaxID=340467 RepID=UPI0003FF7D79|nr:tetratricopeptide repeat protein [Desulfatirhabdium butyrativorans]